MSEPLRRLTDEGVAVWLDDLSRDRLTSGDLAAMVTNQHVVGVTTNPAIFHSAIAGTATYAESLRGLAKLGLSAIEVVRMLTSQDVRAACDVLRGVYEATDSEDGFTSIEVDPRLAHDTARTIADARLAYERYERFVSTERWQRLAAAGARPQRPLWASTGVKDPAYDDTRYVVDLVAPGTVNTMPADTLAAVADHGVIRGDRVTGAYAEARQVLKQLAELGIDYDDVVAQLEHEGVAKFADAWHALLSDVASAMAVVSR